MTERQKIIPYLFYQNGPQALEYLCETFAFELQEKVLRDDGTLMHGEVGYEGNVVMLGTPLDEHGKPRGHESGDRSCCVMCYVDDVDEHFARATESGATIMMDLVDKEHGDRMYGAVDPEGYHWYFATPK